MEAIQYKRHKTFRMDKGWKNNWKFRLAISHLTALQTYINYMNHVICHKIAKITLMRSIMNVRKLRDCIFCGHSISTFLYVCLPLIAQRLCVTLWLYVYIFEWWSDCIAWLFCSEINYNSFNMNYFIDILLKLFLYR